MRSIDRSSVLLPLFTSDVHCSILSNDGSKLVESGLVRCVCVCLCVCVCVCDVVCVCVCMRAVEWEDGEALLAQVKSSVLCNVSGSRTSVCVCVCVCVCVAGCVPWLLMGPTGDNMC